MSFIYHPDLLSSGSYSEHATEVALLEVLITFSPTLIVIFSFYLTGISLLYLTLFIPFFKKFVRSLFPMTHYILISIPISASRLSFFYIFFNFGIFSQFSA